MSIKKDFFEKLIKELTPNDYFVVADLGYGVLDEIREKLGDRFINVGVAEQTMMSIASGLALSGKRVFTFTISSFYLRALEQIKLDINGQGVFDKVVMLGIGTVDSTYDHFGLSHYLLKEDLEALNKYAKCAVVDNSVENVSKLINQYNMIFLPR